MSSMSTPCLYVMYPTPTHTATSRAVAVGEEDSPFLYSEPEIREMHHQVGAKATLVGEFPLEGIAAASNSPVAMELDAAYRSLWDPG